MKNPHICIGIMELIANSCDFYIIKTVLKFLGNWFILFGFSQVTLICFLTLIPWPGPSVFKISCSRDSARIVRKIVQSKWLPILEKYQVCNLTVALILCLKHIDFYFFR